MNPDTEYLRRDQAAEYLMSRFGAYTSDTLSKLACIGGGPRFRRMGRFPLYARKDLDDWAAQRMSPLVGSTSELVRSRHKLRTGDSTT